MTINQQQAQIIEEKALQSQVEGELDDSDLETVAGGSCSCFENVSLRDSFGDIDNMDFSFPQGLGTGAPEEIINVFTDYMNKTYSHF